MSNDISSHFEKAKAEIKAERDSMVQQVKEEMAHSKRRALAKA